VDSPSETYRNNIFSEYVRYVTRFDKGRDRNTEYAKFFSLPFTANVLDKPLP